MSRFLSLVVVAVTLLSPSSGSAIPLLFEDWSSGSIEDTRWRVADNAHSSFSVIELAGASRALALRDTQAPGNGLSIQNNSIVSSEVFARGGNLRLEFRIWRGTEPPHGEPNHFHAGFNNAFYELASYHTFEAGLRNLGDVTFDESQTYGHRRIEGMETFLQAWHKAVSRESALTFRISLGDHTGAAMEWHDGERWHVASDTRGTPVDFSPYQPGGSASTDYLGNPRATGLNISSSAWVRVAFAPSEGGIFIGDVSLSNDLSSDAYAALVESLPEPPIQRRPPLGQPRTNVDFYNDPDNFRFMITADLTGGPRPGVLPDMVNKINMLMPEFVVTVGDLVEGYQDNEYLIERQYEEFDRAIDPLKVPFFYVPGNHDIANATMQRVWRRYYGRDYYHFLYKDVLFLCLNSNDGAHYKLSDEQLLYFSDVLADNPSPRWTIVVIHDPLWIYDWRTGWAEMERLLGERPHTVFSGHTHYYFKMERNGREYYTLATTGGSSTLGGPEADGMFDHVMWVTMTEDGPTVANLMMDGIYPGDVRKAGTPEVDELIEVLRSFMESAAKRLGTYEQ